MGVAGITLIAGGMFWKFPSGMMFIAFWFCFFGANLWTRLS